MQLPRFFGCRCKPHCPLNPRRPERCPCGHRDDCPYLDMLLTYTEVDRSNELRDDDLLWDRIVALIGHDPIDDL